MTTINVDFEELREGDQAVLSGADWTMTGKVVGHDARLFAGTVRISPSVFVSATREVPDARPESVVRAEVETEIVEWLRDEGYTWAATRVQRGEYR